MTKEQGQKVIDKSPYRLPLRYESRGTFIVNDKEQNVLDVRGWGAICRLPDAEKIQDAFGEAVAKCLNDNLAEYIAEAIEEISEEALG